METFPFPLSIHKQFICQRTYPNFHSPIKRKKSQQTFINSAIQIDETNITQNTQNRIKISTTSSEVIPRKPSSQVLLLESLFNTLTRAITKFFDPPRHLSVDPSYILTGNFAPVDELVPTKCEIIHGSIPPCLDGVYIRNGPNPQFVSGGSHHFLDGDGILHSIRISNGQPTFCSRYVKTNKYLHENKVGSYVVPNFIGGMQALCPLLARATLFVARVVLGQYDISNGIGVANTSLAFFGGSLYALCEADFPYAIRVKDNGDIETLRRHDFNGALCHNMTAHLKIDPDTKEAFAFNYWTTRPYMTYFRFDANGNKQPDVPIFSMKQTSITHDLGITKKYAIIFDLAIVLDPMNLLRGKQLVTVDPTKTPRIGILPRYAKDESDMKWFEVPGFNIFHVVNAWDETDDDGGDVVVLVAPNILSIEHFLGRSDLIQTSIEKVSINCRTRTISRQVLSTDTMELLVINPGYAAKKNRYVYAAISEKKPIISKMVRISGVAKLDITTSQDNKEPHQHTVAIQMFGDNCFGSEPFFVARNPGDPNSAEDDGYVVCYMHNESSGESRFLVMDARSPTLEIIAAVKLPQRVPYGLHGIFIREKDLNEM